MKLTQLRQIIREEITKVAINEVNQPYKVISKETEKSVGYGDTVYDRYSLELRDEMYTTPDGLTFQLKTIGYVSIPTGEELDFNNPYHYMHYMQTFVYDENGKELEHIPGDTNGITPSINKAKKWLNQRGAQLMSGKGFQHKST